MRGAFFRLWAGSLLFLAGTLAAQPVSQPERELPGLENDFLLRVWETVDGLLPPSPRSITQTRDGYVWLASPDGVTRFDGGRAVTFSAKNTTNFPTQFSAMLVHAAAAGRLWCGSTAGRLFSHDGAEWREHTAGDGWRRMNIEAIASSPAGKVFFSGGTNLLEYSQGRFSLVATPELPRAFRGPLKVVVAADGRMWLATSKHLWRRDEGGWQRLMAIADAGQIAGFAAARTNGVWIATGRELRRYGNGSAQPEQRLTRPPDFWGDAIQLLEDARGNLWAGGAASGLRVRMKDGRVVPASPSAEGLQAQVQAIFEDRERNVLVATAGGGLARFKPRPFEAHLGRLGGLAGVIVNVLCEESPGQMLVGTDGSGLRRIGLTNALVPFRFQGAGFPTRSRVTSLVKLKEGTVLAAVSGRGLFKVGAKTADSLPSDSIMDELVRSLFEDSKGRLWIGHERGLAMRTNGVIQRFPSGTRPPLTTVRGIAEGWDGTVWFIGKEGLMRLQGDKLAAMELPASVHKANLLAIRADADGAVWVGVESRGLLRFKDGQSKLFTASHGLPFLSVGAIVEEGDHLWLSGDKGLARVSRKSLIAVGEGRATRLELQFFNRADGLPSDAFRRGYQPAAFKADDGRLWFASHKGAVAVRPAEILAPTFEPPGIIEEIRAEKTLIPITAANRDSVTLTADIRYLNLRCSIPTLSRPEYARLQYRLEGFESQWQDAGTERLMRYYDLPRGSYRFQLRGFAADGRPIEPVAYVRLIKAGHYWQSAWFIGLMIASGALLVALVVWQMFFRRLRTQAESLREQGARAELEGQLQKSQKTEAIGRLAGGIAHDFNNLLTVILGNAELLRMKLAGQADAQTALGSILQAGGRARDLVAQILTFSRPQLTAPVAVDLAPALREACQLLRAGTPAMVEVKFDIPETLPPILADTAEIARVILNLGTNAVHAVGPSGGRIHIQAEDFTADAQFFVAHPKLTAGRYVRLTVKDNGSGMDGQTMSRIFDPFFTTKDIGKGTGLGLSVVHGIVEAHHGVITVRSQPGEGTTFEAFFPVTAANAEMKTEMFRPLPKGHGENILLVDDDPAVLPITRMMLEKLGYQVESSPDPHAALKLFTDAPQRFALVITDYAMPGLDGVELSERIWNVRENIPVILYSGYGGQFTPDDAARLGFAQMLEKPFQPHTLAEAVAAALRKAGEGKPG